MTEGYQDPFLMDEYDRLAEERDWIRQALRGDIESYGKLVSRYDPKLRGFAARYLNNVDDVYDLVQDAFVEAFQSLRRFDPERAFWPWLRTICKFRVMNHLRSLKRSRVGAIEEIDDLLFHHADQRDDSDNERLQALQNCIDKLRVPQQTLLTRRFVDNEAVQDIAADMDTSAASITMRLRRIRLVLKDCVEHHVEELTK